MLSIAISPCPNDTYLFWAWIQGLVGESLPINVHYADIDTLNHWAVLDKFPLIKVSMNMLGRISDRYTLLPIGMALGYGVGPKIVSRTPKFDLSQSRVAIPGKHTSANLLFDLFFKASEKHFCTYDEIYPLLHAGDVDAGVIIHESRFTYQKEGFYEVADLGTLWEKQFALPLPLGGLALHHDYLHRKEEICHILQKSLQLAQTEPESMYEFILTHSKEKERSIVKKHIDLYVTKETEKLSILGQQAVDKFLELSRNYGQTSSVRNSR